MKSVQSIGANGANASGPNRSGAPTCTDPALKRSFKGHKEGVISTCFNPNLKQCISGSHDSTVMVWNFKPNIRPFRFVGHKGPVHSVAVTPSGNTIVSGSADETIRVWNNTVEGHS
jgi:centriolar protein POC1